MNQPRSGAFEITINNKLVFSKLQGSAFPTKMQIEKLKMLEKTAKYGNHGSGRSQLLAEPTVGRQDQFRNFVFRAQCYSLQVVFYSLALFI